MIKQTAAVYTAIANKWKQGGPPARPTPFELKNIFKPYIKCLANSIHKRENRTARMLVLGATPEFRDIGLKNRMEVWAVDINPNMLCAVDKFIKYRKSKRSIKIISDWLAMSKKLPNHYFDLVMAEQSFNIVLLKDWPRLCREIIKVLEPKGYILFKVATVTDKIKRKSSAWAIKMYSQKKIKAGDLAWLLHFSPDAKLYNFKKNAVKLKGQPVIVDKAMAKGMITKRQWQEHERKIGAIQRSGIVLNILTKQKTTDFLKKCFEILKIYRGKDFMLCQDMNIYFGKIKR